MLRFSTTLKSDEITSLAIGGFDGMHKAHLELVKRLNKNGVLLVIDKGNSNLTPGDFRNRFIKNGSVFLNLDEVKHLIVDEFLTLLKDNFPFLKRIVVGYDFRFGKDRVGKPESFKRYFDVDTVDEVIVDGISVHSKVVREFIKEADLNMVKRLLTRNYIVLATSIKGQGIGAKELVPTINLQTEFLLPKNGVYATKTKVKNQWYKSISFIGHRVSTDNKFAFETHLIDTKIDFLPKNIEVEFINYIRDNKKFDTIDMLKNQIEEDISLVKDKLD